jgi:hypothetical protein
MTGENDGDDGAPEEFTLEGVPMDDPADGRPPAEDPGEDEEDGEATKQAAAKAKEAEAGKAEREKLTPEQLEDRYNNQKVALAEERRERRALAKRLEALERGETREREPAPRKAPVVEEEIDPDIDPIGAVKQMRAKIKAYEAVQAQEDQTDAERAAEDRKMAAVERELEEHEADFAEENPDYAHAAKHYAASRARELLSFELTAAQVGRFLRKEFATLAETAIGKGKNPAAVVYELAKGRGYVKGGKPAGEGGQEKAKAGRDRVGELIRGAKAANPLGGGGGRPADGLDAATVANINIRDPKGAEAFDKAWERMEAEAKRAERSR